MPLESIMQLAFYSFQCLETHGQVAVKILDGFFKSQLDNCLNQTSTYENMHCCMIYCKIT